MFFCVFEQYGTDYFWGTEGPMIRMIRAFGYFLKDRKSGWKQQVLLPAFRLATKEQDNRPVMHLKKMMGSPCRGTTASPVISDKICRFVLCSRMAHTAVSAFLHLPLTACFASLHCYCAPWSHQSHRQKTEGTLVVPSAVQLNFI